MGLQQPVGVSDFLPDDIRGDLPAFGVLQLEGERAAKL